VNASGLTIKNLSFLGHSSNPACDMGMKDATQSEGFPYHWHLYGKASSPLHIMKFPGRVQPDTCVAKTILEIWPDKQILEDCQQDLSGLLHQ
jgi:hypothetical protein